MVKIAGNLRGLIGEATTAYISENSEDFRSTTPGPQGIDGPQGPIGVGVHHLKGTSTTQSEGDFAYPGETDTYTFYPDANESYPLGWFRVRNGQDAYNYAVLAGYAGTEEDFYLELAAVREYYEQSQVNANSASANAAQVAVDAAQVAADRVVVEDATEVVIAAEAVTVQSANDVQQIFLGEKASDPTVDNQGNPLVVGVMYYNSTTGTLRIWTGVEWSLGAFSVAGAVVSVNGRDGAVELNKADVGLSNVDNTSDLNKPISTATQDALDLKANITAVKSIYEGSADKVLTDVNKIALSTDAGTAVNAGEIAWNPDDRTVDIALGNGVVLQAGQEMIVNVLNGTGSPIGNGKVVMMTTAPGNSGKLVVAPYDGTSPAYLIVGVTTESIAAGVEGRVTSYGRVRGLDTSAWAKDTVLFVDGGNLVSTVPANGLNMRLATVLSQHATNGTLMVRLNGYTQVEEW